MMKRNLCVLLALAGCAGGASAQLFGSDNAGNYFLVDEATGAATIITADDSTYNFGGGATEIEINPATGVGYAQNPDGNFSGNIFDGVTGASLGASNPTADSFQGLEYVGGTLFATGFGGSSTILYTLDPVTGQETVVADTGLTNPLNGLAYDVDAGIMYASSGRTQELFTIDLGTGVPTLVGSMGVTVGSIEFGASGLLYGGGGQQQRGNIYTIDPLTGSSTLVGATGLGTVVTGLTLLPAPSSLALLALAGMCTRRRR